MRNSTTILFIVLALAIGIFYLRPQYQKIQGLKAQLLEYNNALEKAKDLKILRDQLLEKYNNIDPASAALLKKVVPEKFDPVALTAVINNIGQQYGMYLSNVSVRKEDNSSSRDALTGETEDPIPYQKVPITFTFKGNYQSFYKTLADIEKNVQIVDIRKLGIKQLKVDDISAGLQFDVTLDTYWIK
jgi:Tfp pilus assembly protein PilO